MMIIHALVFLVGVTATGSDQALDDFFYESNDSAQAAWRGHAEGGDAVAVKMVPDGDRSVLELPVPFADQPQLSRVYIDREVDLNLASVGEFELEIMSNMPAAGGRISLYFRSGAGWYSGGGGLAAEGWHKLRFSKAGFSIEGQPTGWHKIDAIRIAVWRGRAIDYVIRLRRLAACQNAVAMVIPSAKSGGEQRSALQTAEDVGEMLAELGLGSDAVEDTALADGALGKRSVAILAYNPRLPQPALEALVEYVEQGGRVLACYQLPSRLADALGFSNPSYVPGEPTGRFSEIRFDASDISGIPASVRQASWNITTAQPADYNARVIGEWFDDQGESTNLPAMLISDRGAFFSHVILRDDREKKKQLLAAVLGKLAPQLWRTMAESQLDRAGRVGHLDNLPDLAAFLKSSESTDAHHALKIGQELFHQAQQKHDAGDFCEVVESARDAHEHLCKAYALGQPSSSREGRAFWNHSGTGAYDGDWDRTAKELAAAGFNMILPNMLWGGRAHYASDVLPRSSTYQKYGDQIEQCVAAAKQHGLEVHVWKVNFNLSGAPQAFVDKIRREHRNQVSVDGEAHNWLCPSHPANQELELASMIEVAKKYDVHGLHFDYIRYPGRDKCYCDGCRQRFEDQLGLKVEDWPQECYSGAKKEAYTQWRCDQITKLVKAVHDEAKAQKPDIKISAAVFGAYPDCRRTVAQDWPEWVKAGYLDFVCPMDYTQSDLSFIGLVNSQLKLVDQRIPLYPGIGQWRLSDDRTIGQIHHARSLGADGFTIFNLNRSSAESFVPAVGMGVGRQAAVPPHNN
jgi:uncharacterized lipoprotein YddW (UPF0748 family)